MNQLVNAEIGAENRVITHSEYKILESIYKDDKPITEVAKEWDVTEQTIHKIESVAWVNMSSDQRKICVDHWSVPTYVYQMGS